MSSFQIPCHSESQTPQENTQNANRNDEKMNSSHTPRRTELFSFMGQAPQGNAPSANTNKEEMNSSHEPRRTELFSFINAVQVMTMEKHNFYSFSSLFDEIYAKLDNNEREKILKRMRICEQTYSYALDLFSKSVLELLEDERVNPNEFEAKKAIIWYGKYYYTCQADLKEIRLNLEYKEKALKGAIPSDVLVGNEETSVKNINCRIDQALNDSRRESAFPSPASTQYTYDWDEDIVMKKKQKMAKRSLNLKSDVKDPVVFNLDDNLKRDQDDLSQPDINTFDLDDLISSNECHIASSTFGPANESFKTVPHQENNKIVQMDDKLLVDQITSAMGPGYSSPINNIFENSQNDSENNNVMCSTESDPQTSTIQFISCSYCGKLWKNGEDLQHHLTLVHSPKCCPSCNFTAPGLDEFTSHIEEHRSLKVCQLCGVAIKTDNFDIHYLEAHRPKSPKCFKCTICSKAFKNENKCENHEEKHEEMIYSCLFCERHFSCKYEEKKHNAEHMVDKKKKFACKICYQIFQNGKSLLIHMKKQHYMKDNIVPNATIPCLICYNELPDGESLINHVKQSHQNSAVVLRSKICCRSQSPKDKCPYCDIHIKNPKILAIHKIESHGEAPFACKCGEKFFSKGQLDLHILRHPRYEEVKFNLHPTRGRKRKIKEV